MLSFQARRQANFEKWLPKLQARFPGAKVDYEFTERSQHVITIRVPGSAPLRGAGRAIKDAVGRLKPTR